MISGKWFQRKIYSRIGQTIHTITNYSIKNSGATPIFIILVGAHPRNTGLSPPQNLKEICTAV